MLKGKICIFSTVHRFQDTRIYHKEAKTLARIGYDVDLLIQCDKNKFQDKINLIALPKSKNRIHRIINAARVLRLCLIKDYKVYHFHDPELIWVGLTLKVLTGKVVIYDVHENYTDAILVRPWIPEKLKKIVVYSFSFLEGIMAKHFDLNIFADDGTAHSYNNRNIHNTAVIHNYPILEYFKKKEIRKELRVAYVGKIVEERGIWEMLRSVEIALKTIPSLRFDLIGDFDSRELEEKVKNYTEKLSISKNIVLWGFLPNNKIAEILERSLIGFVIVNKERFKYNLPTKLFEYMLSNSIVIATGTDSIKRFITDKENGIIIDNNSHEMIAEKLIYLFRNDYEARKIAQNAYEMVLRYYNWENESKKLESLYNTVMNSYKSQLVP